MKREENTDKLRLVSPQLSRDGQRLIMFIKVADNDYQAHKYLKLRHFKYFSETENWVPMEKELFRTWNSEDYGNFRLCVLEFLKIGYILYADNFMDILFWVRDFQIYESFFAVYKKEHAWQEKLMMSSSAYDVENLRHDGKYYLGKIFAYNDYHQMELAERANEEKELLQPIFEIDERIVH